MRSILGWVISKTLNMLPVVTLLGAQHFKASIGEMPVIVMLVTYVHPDLIKANRTSGGGGRFLGFFYNW